MGELSFLSPILFVSLLSFIGTWCALRLSGRMGLLQNPNDRSSHTEPTPTAGGLGIMFGLSLVGAWLSLSADQNSFDIQAILGLGLVLGLIGLGDDIFHLPARLRFLAQVLICAGLLTSMPELPGQLMLSLGFKGPTEFSYLTLTALLVLGGVWWINLFNFMDGIDGIAGCQAVLMFLAGALLVFCFSPEAMSDPAWKLLLCGSGATVGFLFFNWPPAKIFMGDVGSTYLAFMIFALALWTLKMSWFPPLAGFVSWLILGSLFLADATVTLVTRIVRGERWYEAHRNHAYQKLSRLWTSSGLKLAANENLGFSLAASIPPVGQQVLSAKIARADQALSNVLLTQHEIVSEPGILIGGQYNHASVTRLSILLNLIWVWPLAWLNLFRPEWTLGWLVLAYVPLVAGILYLGAGKPDENNFALAAADPS